MDASPTFPLSWAPGMEYSYMARQGIDPGQQEGVGTGGDGTWDSADATGLLNMSPKSQDTAGLWRFYLCAYPQGMGRGEFQVQRASIKV